MSDSSKDRPTSLPDSGLAKLGQRYKASYEDHDADRDGVAPPTAPATESTEPRKREFEILMDKRDHVETALTKLNKRATRKGLPLISYAWGTPYMVKVQRYDSKNEPLRNALNELVFVNVAKIPLTLTGEKPSYAGWTFIATLQHLGEENIVRAVPGEAVPTMFRARGPMCDHCKMFRRRNDTYLVRHEDGRVLQVGSNCLRDFLGSSEAENIAAMAQYLADAADIAEDGEQGGGSYTATVYALDEYLPMVAWLIREHGWISRTAARERDSVTATANLAWTLVDHGSMGEKARREMDAKPTEADVAMAAGAEAWAVALTDEALAGESGDYLHNLRAIARTGMVTHRTDGIAASMVSAYQRFLGMERKKAQRALDLNEYAGTVGVRATWLLTLDFLTGYDTQYGYITILKFKDAEGRTFVWKASSTGDAEIGKQDVGKVYTVMGTVKKHEEYKGMKQTQLSRCVLHEGVWTPPAKEKKVKAPKPATTRTKEIIDAAAADDNMMVSRSYGKGTSVEIWTNGGIVGKVSFADITKAMALGELHTLYPGALDRIGGQSPIVRGPAPAPAPVAVAPVPARDPETQDPVDPKAPRAPLAGEEGYSPYRTDDHYH